MRRLYPTFIAAALTAALLASCRPAYKVTNAEVTRIPIDSTLDAQPDAETAAMLVAYKAQVDSIMQEVVGNAAQSMDVKRPESLLSNLIADVLREAATDVLGHPADAGLVNMGGIRNVLTKGPITMENVFEILPFENSLCVLTMKGSALKQLCADIAAKGGEGISGIRLEISKERKLLKATIGGKPIANDHTYTLSTIDYLADGNDGMTSCQLAETRTCPPGATLRSLFLNYVKRLAAKGESVSSKMDGRITMK